MDYSSTLATIIVHYGAVELTYDCVASLECGTVWPLIIVVSNSSADETELLCQKLLANGFTVEEVQDLEAISASMLSNDFPVVVVCRQPHNRGYAAGVNVGLRLACTNSQLKYIWLLNNDTTVAPDAVEQLLVGFKENPRHIIGTSVFQCKSPQQLELALGCKFSPFTTRCQPCFPGALLNDVPGTPDVDYIYGASWAFPVKLVDEIGWLDEQFFLYYEEHDFCLRAMRRGYGFHWCREAKIWHQGGASTNTMWDNNNESRQFSHYHENLSTFRFLRKHYPYALFSALIVRTIAKIFILPMRGQGKLLKSYWKAFKTFSGLSSDKRSK